MREREGREGEGGCLEDSETKIETREGKFVALC